MKLDDGFLGIYHKNNPEKYYPRIIKGHYAEGNALEGGARSFDAIVHFRVKKALETGDMEMLGQMLVEGEKRKPVEVSSNEDIATIGQLCTIQHYMKNKLFDLSTTEYKDPTMVDRMNTAMKNSTLLEQFRTKHLHREDTLDDVILMAKLYTNAINLKKPHSVSNRQLQNSVDKQNDMQNQQSQKINPMT